jgi:hypothetical protein
MAERQAQNAKTTLQGSQKAACCRLNASIRLALVHKSGTRQGKAACA